MVLNVLYRQNQLVTRSAGAEAVIAGQQVIAKAKMATGKK